MRLYRMRLAWTSVVLAALFVAWTINVHTASVPGVLPQNVSYSLLADTRGWNYGEPGGKNPLLTAATGERIAISIAWVLASTEGDYHNFAVYPPGYPIDQVRLGNPDALFRSADVSIGNPTASIAFRLLVAGDYLYVCDFHPMTMAGTLRVRSNERNTPPTLGPATASPTPAIPDQEVVFRVNASDPDGDPLSYTWNFGDGASVSGSTEPGGGPIEAVHAYGAPGDYAATLLADDGRGGTATASLAVTVQTPALLRVRTSIDRYPDAGVPGKILVDGVPRDEWGLAWVRIAPGLHRISFTDVWNLGTPDPITVDLHPGLAEEVMGTYRAYGWLRVTTSPPVPATIIVNGLPMDDWGTWLAVPAREYVVSFGPVAGYRPPGETTVTVQPETLTHVVGEYVFDGVSPGPDPGSYGLLRVRTAIDTDPSAGVPSAISVNGDVRNEWATTWVKLPPGTYTVSFGDVVNLGTPKDESVGIVSGQTTQVVGVFRSQGFLRVTTDPPVPGTIFVNGVPRNDWGMWQSMEPGTYRVSFGRASGYLTPTPSTVVVTAGELTHVEGAYVHVFRDGLDFWPTALAFASDGRIFVADRYAGQIRILEDGMFLPDPFVGLLGTATSGEQGLLGIALDPDFPASPWVYAYQTYNDPNTGATYNRVVRIRAEGNVGTDLQVLLAPIPAGTYHNGGVIAFGPDRTLFVLVGDTHNDAFAQDLSSWNGKVLRLNPDGSVPVDNPFVGQAGANPYVYTYGHRNMFGIAFHPTTGRPYITENGPQDSDEVNILVAGGNYGWPIVRGIASTPPYIDPIAVYTPVIAPTNAAFLGDDLLLGGWNSRALHRLRLLGPAYDVVGSQAIVLALPDGILDVERGADRAVWITTPGAIYRWPSLG